MYMIFYSEASGDQPCSRRKRGINNFPPRWKLSLFYYFSFFNFILSLSARWIDAYTYYMYYNNIICIYTVWIIINLTHTRVPICAAGSGYRARYLEGTRSICGIRSGRWSVDIHPEKRTVTKYTVCGRRILCINAGARTYKRRDEE